MEELIKKENDIFDILQKFINAKLDFIVVGGYAVSAFKHRFSVDADIVIQSKDLDKFEAIVKKEDFKKTSEKKLENIYSSRFLRYEKDTASVDLMIDAVSARATGASFSYKLLLDNSAENKIIGIEKEISARVPVKEMMIVMKIHSGRLTDFRDIAALAKDTDLEEIRKLVFIGDLNALNTHLKKIATVVKDKNFVDSFKGVFMEKKFDIDLKQVEQISRLKQ
ncbi:hypothetical protein COU54_03325 [Candidatus Pacearchaeota archaeon CG10_big_fil_rev_8_21_14_0_10_31_24]|nr:MAG: hypothetical protein COU54_03325 [Candidatus Pacearchaeota archaeon CG10_big_fil_rev_8_21_14_0_10_31_24]